MSEHEIRPVRMGLSEDRCQITNDVARKSLHWTGLEPLLDTSELRALLVEDSHLNRLQVLSQAMECDSEFARHYHEQVKLFGLKVSERARHRFLGSLSASVAEGAEEPAKLLFEVFMDRNEPAALRAQALFALIPPEGRPAAPLHILSRLHNYVVQMNSSDISDASVVAQAMLVLGGLARRHHTGVWGEETMAKAHEIIRMLRTELALCDSSATCSVLLVALGNTADLDSQQLIVPYLQHSDDPHLRCARSTTLGYTSDTCWGDLACAKSFGEIVAKPISSLPVTATSLLHCKKSLSVPGK